LECAEFGYFGVARLGEAVEFGADVWPCVKICSILATVDPGGGGGTISTDGGVIRHTWGDAQPDRSTRNRATSNMTQLGEVRIRSIFRTLTSILFCRQEVFEFRDFWAKFISALLPQKVYPIGYTEGESSTQNRRG
jgi:hypothetical protein